MISADPRYERRKVTVKGLNMAYVEAGSGAPMVFIHGNPTSSYLWRNVMPHLEAEARVIAPDLIGMGDSDKLPDSGPDRYTFVEHREYLDELLDKLGRHGKRHPGGTGLGICPRLRLGYAARGSNQGHCAYGIHRYGSIDGRDAKSTKTIRTRISRSRG